MLNNRVTSHRPTVLWFGLRMAIIVAVLATMLQAAIINPPKAFASTYDCESNPRVTSGSCYGMVSWFGGTFGVTEHIYVNPLTCTNCHASNGYKLNEEVWLVDENSGGYVEVGYGARPLQNGAQWYFWANTPPNQGQARFDLAPVPAADYYNYTGFKMTRNRQGNGNVLVQVWSAGYNWSTVTSNSMGGSNWTGNRIDIGSELRGSNYGGPIFQSSNGWIRWTGSQWQTNDGLYHYQTDSGTTAIDNPQWVYWYLFPWQTSDGGLLYESCGC